MQCPLFVHQLVRWWETTQVELHGLYSIERLQQLKCYSDTSSLLRVLAVVMLTPMPCLILVVLADATPLEPPVRGLQHSQIFWIRAAVMTFITTFTLVEQCRRFIPDLHMTLRQVTTIAVVGSMGSTLMGFGLATAIGFPIPFTINVCGPTLLLLLTSCYEWYYGRLLRAQPSSWQEVKNYFAVLAVQFTLTTVYPLYISVFIRLRSSEQIAFTLLLPVIKLAGKNLMSCAYRHTEDFKPETVIFNAEVFHALFVACSMQSSTSINVTLVLMLVDFVQFWISFQDITAIMQALETIERLACSRISIGLSKRVGVSTERTRISMLKMAIYISEHFPQVAKSASRRALLARSLRTRRWAITSIFPEPNDTVSTTLPPKIDSPHGSACSLLAQNNKERIARNKVAPHVAATDGDEVSTGLSEYEVSLVEKMNHAEKIQFVHLVLKLMHMTEYLMLVEFTEVIIPVVYSKWSHSSRELGLETDISSLD